MSLITLLGENYSNLPNVLKPFYDDLENVKDILRLDGKLLTKANSENSAWLFYYDQKKVELHTLVKFFKMEEDRIRSSLFKKYKENYSLSLTDREINRYIDGEEKFLSINKLKLEVEELYETYQAIVNALTSRNYALTNITKLRIASLENEEI